MVLNKKLKRSILESLSPSKIFGAAILFIITNIALGSELIRPSVILTDISLPISKFGDESLISDNSLVESDLFLNSSPSIPAPDPQVVCEGANASFSVTGGATHQWAVSTDGGSNWSNLTGQTSPSLTLNSVSYSMTGYLYHCLIDGNESASASLTVNRYPAVAGVIAPTTPVCQGDVNKTFSVAPITLATSYTWTFPSGATVISGTYAVSVNFSSSAISGAILVSGTNGCGNGPSSSSFVTVNPLPVAAGTITGTASVCQGATGVKFSIDAISNATNYIWTVPVNATIVSSSLTPTPNITVDFPNTAVSGNVTVHGTNSCGSGTNSPNFPVSITQLVVNTGNISGSQTVCQGAAQTFNVTNIPNATSYIWSYSGTGANISGTTSSESISFTANATPGNLTVKGANSCGNGPTSVDYPINVAPLPAAAAPITGTSSVCLGQSNVTYQVPAIANATSYTWVYSGTGASFSGTTNPVWISFSPSATSGVLTVIGHNDCGDGIVSANYTISVISPQVAVINIGGIQPKICAGTTYYPVNDVSVNNASSLLWDTNGTGTGTFTNSTTVNPTYFPSAADVAAGSVTLRLRANANSPCTVATYATKTLVIQARPIVYAGPDDQICEDGVYTTSGASVFNAVSDLSSPHWDNGSGDGSFVNELLPITTYIPGTLDKQRGGVTLTLSGTSIGPCTGIISSSFFLTINKLPTSFAGNDSTICANSTFTVIEATAANYSSLEWTSSGSGNFSNKAVLLPTYTPSDADIASGYIILTLKAKPNAPCGSDFSSTMRLNIVPVADVTAGPDASICQGSTYTIMAVANNHDAANIGWSTNGTGTFSGDALQRTYNPSAADITAGSVILTITVRSQSGCSVTATDFMVLTIVPTPVVNAGPDANVCSGSSFPITGASTQSGASVKWTKTIGTGSFSNESILNPTYIPSTDDFLAGHVHLKLTATPVSPCSSPVSDEFVLTFVAPPTAVSDHATDQICQSQSSITISGFSSNSSNLRWSTSGTGTFVSENTLTPTYSPSSADNSAGSVTLTLHAAGTANCTEATAIRVLTLALTPTISVGSNVTICQGSSITVNDATARNYASLLWRKNGLGTLSGETTRTPTYVPATGETGIVTLILTAEASSPCTEQVSATKTITIQPLPTANAGPNASTCDGTAYILSGNVSNSTTYTWATTGSGTLSGASTLTPSYIPSAADAITGSVTITLTASAIYPCASNVSDVMILTVLPRPMVNAGSDDSICASGSFNLSQATTLNTSSILWSKSGGDGTFSNAGSLNATYTPGPRDISTGQVRLTLTGQPNSPCSSPVSDYMVLTIVGVPTADAGPPTVSICKEGYTLSGASATNYSSLHWSGGSGTLTNENSLTPTYTPTGTEITNGSVTLTLTVNGTALCGGSATDNITLLINPAAPTISVLSANSPTFCEGNSITLTGAPSGYNYTWTPGGSSTQNLIVTASGSYRVVISDPVTGCSSLPSNPINVTVNPTPRLSSPLTHTAMCSGTNFSYTPASSTAGTSYTWIRPLIAGISPAQASGGNGVNPNETLNNTNTSPVTVTYIYTLTTADGCSNSQNVTVVVNPLPLITSSLTPASICSGSQFSYNPTSSTTGATFNWTRQPVSGIQNATASGIGNPNEVLYNSTADPIPVTYQFYASISGCQNPTPALVVVVVNPTPSLSSTLTPAPMCSGDIFSYIPSSNPSGATMTWSRATVSGISQPAAAGTGNISEYLTNTSAIPVNVTYAYTMTLNRCSSTQNVVVAVYPVPVLSSSLSVLPVCHGATFNYTPTSATPGASFNWTSSTGASGSGNISETLLNNTVSPIQVTYTILVSANGCPVTSAPYNILVTVYPTPLTPVATITSGSTPFCEGSSITITSSAGNSYQWSNGATSQSLVVTSTGSYSVVVSDVAGCHSGSSVPISVNMNPAPQAPGSGGDIKQCIDATLPNTLVATATPPAGSTVEWFEYPTGGTKIDSPSLSTKGEKIFYAESVNSTTLCRSLSRTPVKLSLIDYPAKPVASDQIACEESPLQTLTASAIVPYGSTVKWYATPIGGPIIDPIPTLHAVKSVTYYAETDNGYCTSLTRTPVVLTIVPAPAAPTSFGTASKCAEATIVPLRATATATVNSDIIWFTSPTGGSQISGNDPVLDHVGTVTYYAEAKDKTSGCVSLTRSAPVTLTINPTPAQPTTLKAIDEICQTTASSTLTATASASGGANVVWYNAASGGSLVNPPTLSVPGEVTYWAQAVLGTCTSPSPRTTSVKLTIKAAPVAPTSLGDLEGCSGTLLNASTQIASTVSWFTTPTGGNGINSPILDRVGSIPYYAESLNGGCPSMTRTPVKLTIVETPERPIIDSPILTGCEKSPIVPLTASATVSTVGATINWYTSLTGGTPIPAGQLAISNVTTTPVIYYAEAVNGKCISPGPRPSVSITLNPAPAPPKASLPLVICASDPLVASSDFSSRVTPPPSGYLIEWFSGPTDETPLTLAPKFSELGTGPHTFYAGTVNSNTGCRSLTRVAVTVTINAIPADPVTSKPEDYVCATGSAQTLTATATSPDGSTIKWYKTETGGLPISGQPSVNTFTTAAVDYWAEAENGTCKSSRRTKVSLWIVPVPSIPVVGPNKIECEKSPIQILATDPATSTNSDAILWYTTSTGGLPVDPTLNMPGTITLYAEGVSAYLTSIGGYCTSVARSKPVVLTITAAPNPPVIDLSNDTIECATIPIKTLIAKATITSGSITWYDVATGGQSVFTPTWNSIGDKPYWAEAKVGSCPSLTRTKVTLHIVALPTVPVPTKVDLVVCESTGGIDATSVMPVVVGIHYHWYDAAKGGNEISPVQKDVGTRTVYVESRNGTDCASATRVAIKMTIVKAPPSPVSTGDVYECVLNTVDANKAIVPNAAYTLKWYDMATGGAVVSSPTLNRSTTTVPVTYYASYLDPVTHCESVTRTAVKIGLPPVLTATAFSNSPVSPGKTLSLSGGPKDSITPPDLIYLWTAPNGFIYNTANVSIPNVTIADAGKYKLTVTSTASGCSSAAEVNVLINNSLAAYQPACMGGTLNLIGNPDNMKSYSWTGPNSFSSEIQNPVIENITAAGEGVYTLVTIDVNGKITTSSVDVKINPLPDTFAMSNSPVGCNGSLELIGGPDGMLTYSWSGPGLPQTTPSSQPNLSKVNFTPGDYILTVVDKNGCSSKDTILVEILKSKPSFVPICSGTTLKLIGEPNNMSSYRWTGPNGFASILQSPSILNITPAQLGTYRLIVTDSKGCISLPDTVRVDTSIPSAKIVVNPAASPICEGTTVTLNGSPTATTEPYTYEWTGPNGFTSTLQNPVIPNVRAVDAGSYTLKVSNATGCSTTANITLSLTAVKFNGIFGPYCQDDSKVNLSVSPAGVVLTGDGIGGSVTTGFTFDPSVAKIGVHQISYIYSDAAQCNISGSQDIIVLDYPKVVINPVVLKTCTGSTADITLPSVIIGSTLNLYYTYWSDAKASMAIPDPKNVGAGLYYIKGSTRSGKCFDIKPVTVSQPDSLRGNIIASSILNCAGDTTGTLTVNITMGKPSYKYLWSMQPVQTTAMATNLRAGIYTVVVTDANKCMASFSGEIKEPPPTKLGFSVKAVQCMSDANGSASVDTINGSTDVAILNSYKYKWLTNPVQTTREALRLTPLWHRVDVTDPKTCLTKDSVFVSVTDTTRPSITCPKDINMTVAYLKTSNFDPNKYIVDLGKPLVWDNCTVIDTMVLNDAPVKFRTGETLVKWTVTDQMGLINSCIQKVYVKEIPAIPQMISPNGDGLNDKFIIEGLTANEYCKSQLLIFTRAGQLVFQNDNYEDPANAWDGKYAESTFSKNQLVAPGVYYYILRLGTRECAPSSQTLKGYVYVYY